MKLPTPVDYRAAVQIPQRAFKDDVLRRGKPVRNALGLPKVASGGFALTFKVEVGSECFAVRCFHKEGNHLKRRYAEIADFIGGNEQLDFLVDVDYIPAGIQVRDRDLPIVRMRWVDGEPLSDWIDDYFDEPDALGIARRRIREAVTALRRAGVAHGDLQHGNILVGSDHQVRFVDYDGMFLPALRELGASERGHRNYQHPERADHYDESIDLFATFVIDLSLEALQYEPGLWDKFHTGENLLFSAADFVRPEESEVFAGLAEIGPLADRLQRLREACTVDFSAVPETLGGAGNARGNGRTPRSHYNLPRPVPAAERETLLACQGDEVTTFGQVTDTRVWQTAYGKMAFINLGDWRRGDFAIIAFDRTCVELCQEYDADLTGLRGRWVSITGLVTAYRGKRPYWTPQIELSRLRALRMLDAQQVKEFEEAADCDLPDEPEQVCEPPNAQRSWRDVSEPPQTRSAPASASAVPLHDRPAVSASGAADLQQRLGKLYSSPGFAAQVSPRGEKGPTGSATRSPVGELSNRQLEPPPPTQSSTARPPLVPGPVPPQHRVYRLPPEPISPPPPPNPPPYLQSGWSAPSWDTRWPTEPTPQSIWQQLKRWFRR
ncbi:serine/threonine protein kinase [Saccharopolyspora pogona]|uniref:serine/threonine protein kinase n=1 Tax=Saccharopolyspora pogona TaxID=333966 RepID=UPI001687EFB4|nr:serine/threonine-protein kinase [Saccharopolyspora pogona]